MSNILLNGGIIQEGTGNIFFTAFDSKAEITRAGLGKFASLTIYPLKTTKRRIHIAAFKKIMSKVNHLVENRGVVERNDTPGVQKDRDSTKAETKILFLHFVQSLQ